MEEIQSNFRKLTDDAKLFASAMNARLSLPEAPAEASPPANAPSVLPARPPRQMVSLWTCSKLCGVFFVAGVIVGYTLKRRVRRWAAKILRRLKDD